MRDVLPRPPRTWAGARPYRIGGPLPEAMLTFLRAQAAKLAPGGQTVRPWHYWELHNPWSRAGTFYDSWGFLDLCHAPALLDPVTELLGSDIVLFDSGWLPDPSVTCGGGVDMMSREPVSDAHRFPVEPLGGVTVLVAFAKSSDGALTLDLKSPPQGCTVPLLLEPGAVCALEAQLPYRVRGFDASGAPSVYAVRYFPATAHYSRDPAATVHRDLTERYPLLNYARLPLWLVRGEDRANNDFVTGLHVRAAYWSAVRP